MHIPTQTQNKPGLQHKGKDPPNYTPSLIKTHPPLNPKPTSCEHQACFSNLVRGDRPWASGGNVQMVISMGLDHVRSHQAMTLWLLMTAGQLPNQERDGLWGSPMNLSISSSFPHLSSSGKRYFILTQALFLESFKILNPVRNKV